MAVKAFCPRCGNQIEAGQDCGCSADQSAVQDFLESVKNRMGLGEPESNETDTYERNMLIVPHSIRPSENETPVKQYNIAVLRNLFRFERAEGRLQLTNKRILFRAAGRSLGGRTISQQEFAIDEIAGIEAERNYRFNFFFLTLGLLVAAIFAVTGFGISVYFGIIFGIIIGLAGLIPFFIIHKKFLLKLLFLGLSLGSFFYLYEVDRKIGTLIFLAISAVLTLWGLWIYAMRPNLVLMVKNKGGIREAAPVRMFRTSSFGLLNVLASLFYSKSSNITDYSEVMPTDETEGAIREINAIINDIQKLGDLGVQKWAKHKK